LATTTRPFFRFPFRVFCLLGIPPVFLPVKVAQENNLQRNGRPIIRIGDKKTHKSGLIRRFRRGNFVI
jgi:hypothetical protein